MARGQATSKWLLPRLWATFQQGHEGQSMGQSVIFFVCVCVFDRVPVHHGSFVCRLCHFFVFVFL